MRQTCQQHGRTCAWTEGRETVNESNRCAVYARYSSEKQNPLTIEQQIRKCREYAGRHNLRVLDEHTYADEAISGGRDDRSNLRRLLAVARQKPRQFDIILVDDTSRLSRRLAESLNIHEELQFIGIRVIFVAQGIDTSSEQAELLVATHGIVDSLYLKDLAKRTFRGVEQRALDGLHTGGRVFGYHRVPIESATQRDSHGRPVIEGVRLAVDESQAGAVRKIFERYAAGDSLKRIAIDLNSEGVASPQRSLCRMWRTEVIAALSFGGRLSNCARKRRGSAFIGESPKMSGTGQRFPLNASFLTNSGTRFSEGCSS